MISKRIKCIIDAVEGCETAADVGCDHGYIGAGLLTCNKVGYVIFTDVSEDSLDKARALCRKKELTRCSFHCVDGIVGSPDCAVIAGLGGREIISILSRALPPKLVLQPQKNAYELRVFLADKYSFVSERVIYDRKYYTLMSLKRSEGKRLSQEDLITGDPLVDDDFISYVNYRYAKLCALRRTSDILLIKEKDIIENKYPHLLRERIK